MNDIITISSKNATNYTWIWDFLQKQRQSGQYVWQANQTFTYNGQSFKFEQLIFARKRKLGGYAYEMTSNQLLGAGAFGIVYRIACTLSDGKSGIFQVKDKNRVVKSQEINRAKAEYKIARHAEHLHAKKPIEGRMVMKAMAGQTLGSFLRKNQLSREERLELTKELLATYKRQVKDKNLAHNDLHAGNILINTVNTAKKYELNIIDYGFGDTGIQYSSKDLKSISYILKNIWSKHPGVPLVINNLLNNKNFPKVEDSLKLLEQVLWAPTVETQKPLDHLLTYFKKLSATHHDLEIQLNILIKNAVKNSTPTDIEPLKKAVLECKNNLLINSITPVWLPIFDTDPQKQELFNQIFTYYKSLENKGKILISKSQKKEGEALCQLASELWKKTFCAVYKSPNKQKAALNQCTDACQKLLRENKNLLNIHQNNHYLWAEIGAIFCSLIVLYPIVAGINYLATGRIGFFSQTNATIGAIQMNEHFNTLNTITVN